MPASLQDMELAAMRFARAIVAREPIAIFGDYDVDGAASVALIQRFLRAHGQTAATYIPDRLSEGYGPTPASLAGLAEEGARLIITVDCGTAAGPAIEAANRCGAEIIVVDHHQADEELPPAFAVLNPNRQDDLSGQGHLAAWCFSSWSPRLGRSAAMAFIVGTPSLTFSLCSTSWRSPPCATWSRSKA